MEEYLKKIGKAFLAAITSPSIVKIEEGAGVIIVTRVLLSAGASVGTVDLVEKFFKSIGW